MAIISKDIFVFTEIQNLGCFRIKTWELFFVALTNTENQFKKVGTTLEIPNLNQITRSQF